MQSGSGPAAGGRRPGVVGTVLVVIGAAFVALVVLGVLVGLVRGDVAGTLGSVVSVGMGVTAVVLVLLLALRRGDPR